MVIGSQSILVANTDLKIGLCLDPHDLAASKLAAGRDKDWAFVEVMLAHHIADAATLINRIETLPVGADKVARLKAWVTARQNSAGRIPHP